MSKMVDVKSIVSHAMKNRASEVVITSNIGSIFLNLFSNGYAIEVSYEDKEYMELIMFIKHRTGSYDQSVTLHRLFNLNGKIEVKYLDCFFNEMEEQSYSFELGEK